MNKTKLFIFSLFTCLLSTSYGETEVYTSDLAHSSVEFKVSHFFSKVTGSFQKFQVTLEVDRNTLENSSVKTEIEVSSIDTRSEARDKHLKNADYFDVEKFPKMTFESKSWKKISENEFEVAGDLSLHGVVKPVVLNVKCLGFGEGMKKMQISGWEARAKIKRSDFGITAGTPAVGDEVEIEINIEAHKK